MGTLARSAKEAGATVLGIRPSSLDHFEPAEKGIEIEKVTDLFERKSRMIATSDAFVVLPGGLGTLDEFFEVATTAQLGLHRKPIILLNVNRFFDPLVDLIQRLLSEGFVYGDITKLFFIADTADRVIEILSEQHLTF